MQRYDPIEQILFKYKIYIEGSAWSVSEKYILACDSVTLIVTPKYYDFFTRSLMPIQHFWPINLADQCRSIKFAVDWGNSHKKKAQEIGREANNFVQNDLKMEYVYDYMFHLLSEYGKLMRYKPTIPENATELCSETVACPAEGRQKDFMLDSMVMGPKETQPCSMPPAFNPAEVKMYLNRKANAVRKIELWERKYWDSAQNQKM